MFTVIESDLKLITFLPWFHRFGFGVLIYLATVQIETVSLSKFDSELYLSVIQRYKITSTVLAPPVVVLLAKDKMVDHFDLSSLKEIFTGAAPLQADTELAVLKRLPSVKIIRQGYGMTEGLTLVICPCPPHEEVKRGSIGILPKGTEMKVVDVDTGKLLGPYKQGEFRFRGPQIMMGYVGNEEATKNSFDEDGFLRTGDVGYYDNDGYFFIVDRLKELIKYKGFQVPPAELESLLLTHPDVKDAAVVGIPDERCGELPMAFIVRQPVKEGEKPVMGAEIIQFVADRSSPAKRLHGGVRFVEEIPKNPSGKILRRVLREMLNSNGAKSKL